MFFDSRFNWNILRNKFSLYVLFSHIIPGYQFFTKMKEGLAGQLPKRYKEVKEAATTGPEVVATSLYA